MRCFSSGVGWAFFGGGHQTSAKILEGVQPEFTVLHGRLIVLEFVKRHLPFFRAVSMAVEAIALQDGPDDLAKFRRPGGTRRIRHKSRQGNARENQDANCSQ